MLKTLLDALFAMGTKLAICEPFFKLQTGDCLGVRVDDPKDVLFLDALGPSGGDTPGA